MRVKQKQGCNCKDFFTSAYKKKMYPKNNRIPICLFDKNQTQENVKSYIFCEGKLKVTLIFVHNFNVFWKRKAKYM